MSIFASCIDAKAAISLLVFLPILFIDPSFRGSGFSGRNDSNDLVIAFLVDGMGDLENYHVPDQPHGLPAVLAFDLTALNPHRMRIVEDEYGSLKADFMLCPVPAVLFFVSNKALAVAVRTNTYV